MLKTLFIVLLTLAGSIVVFGQRSFGIKIYQNTDIFDSEVTDTDAKTKTTVHNVNAGRFTIALNLVSKNKMIHEIELFIPEVSKSLDNMQYPMDYNFRKSYRIEGKGSSYSLRYELSKMVTKEDKRLRFSGGVGVNPYYVHLEYFPLNTQTYYSSSRLYGAAINIIPRLTFDLAQGFYLDLSVPLKVYDLRVDEFQVNNPAIPVEQQISTDYNSIFFENAYTIRLGLAYTINKGN
jgi:hypothetical protein